MYKDDVTNINEFIKNIKFDDIQGVTKKIALKSNEYLKAYIFCQTITEKSFEN